MSNRNKKIIICLFLFILILTIITSSFIANDINHIKYCNKENCNTFKIIKIFKCFFNTLLNVLLINLMKFNYSKLILYQKKLKKHIKIILNSLIELKVQFNT